MQIYYAKSLFVSKTFWVNIALFIVAAAELTEVTNLIPAEWMPGLVGLVALINLALRMFTVRPVAIIPPGESRPEDVPSL